MRLLADGSLDGGFGLSGKSRISFGTVGMAAGIQEARAIAVLADGKLLLGDAVVVTLLPQWACAWCD